MQRTGQLRVTLFAKRCNLQGLVSKSAAPMRKTMRKLARAGFRRFKKDESGKEEEEADREFDALLAQQKDKWKHSSGKHRVRVADPNGLIRHFTGVEDRSGVKRSEVIDDVQADMLSSQIGTPVNNKDWRRL